MKGRFYCMKNEIWAYNVKQIEEILNILNVLELKAGIINAEKLVRIYSLLSNPIKNENEENVEVLEK